MEFMNKICFNKLRLRFPLYSRLSSDEEAVTTVYKPNYLNIITVFIISLVIPWTIYCWRTLSENADVVDGFMFNITVLVTYVEILGLLFVPFFARLGIFFFALYAFMGTVELTALALFDWKAVSVKDILFVGDALPWSVIAFGPFVVFAVILIFFSGFGIFSLAVFLAVFLYKYARSGLLDDIVSANRTIFSFFVKEEQITDTGMAEEDG